MRFSKTKKFVYLANPKTGSTSVRKILDHASDHNDLIKKGTFHPHWSAIEFKTIFEDNGWQWESFYRFLTIRNPWKKYLSNYFYSKPDDKFRPFYDRDYCSNNEFKHSFTDWVKYFTKDIGRFPPGCPPLKNFAFDRDHCLVDDIFPIETFANSALPIIKERLSLPSETQLGCLNKSKKPDDFRIHFDDETAELVGNICQLDINIGGYTWQPSQISKSENICSLASPQENTLDLNQSL